MAVLTSACGTVGGTGEMATARRQLDEHMAECTKRYGYDPEAATNLGPDVLGRGEREWRGCVYEGIETYLIPRTRSPELYRRAIAEDREMTEAVANGAITREQRQTRVQQILKEIEQVEEANREKLQAQTLDRLEVEMRQDMMRRSLGPLRR